MSSFDRSGFLFGSLGALAAVVVLMSLTWVVARQVGRHSVVDVAWGLGFVVVAAVSWALAGGQGNTGRRTVVLALTATWGVRLAAHLWLRSRAHPGEDPRYAALLDRAEATGASRTRTAVTRIYLTQGLSMWFVSLPVQVAMFQSGGLGVLGVTGILVWAVGLGFESVGDHQLAAFRRDPGSSGAVLDTGLWRYTRHPNYFGDACVWWGLSLIAFAMWPGVLTILSPVLMTFLLVRGTGARLLEGTIGDRRPGYADYVGRTSGFLPLPPRSPTR